jgi:FkbM family methyltransferase
MPSNAQKEYKNWSNYRVSEMKFYLIEKLIRELANKFGLDIKRYKKSDTEFGNLCKMLSLHRIEQVIDVGANTGQFAKSLRNHGYAGEIISFEPTSIAWRALVTASKNDNKWHVADRCAVGDIEGTLEINISSNSVSSSLLEMDTNHLNAAPESVYSSKEIVKICTLDNYFKNHGSLSNRIFLKIDTQGYEMNVLQGAESILSRTTGIQIELSLIKLYEGQMTHKNLTEFLESKSYEIWSLTPGFTNKASGRMLQFDATFFKHIGE